VAVAVVAVATSPVVVAVAVAGMAVAARTVAVVAMVVSPRAVAAVTVAGAVVAVVGTPVAVAVAAVAVAMSPVAVAVVALAMSPWPVAVTLHERLGRLRRLLQCLLHHLRMVERRLGDGGAREQEVAGEHGRLHRKEQVDGGASASCVGAIGARRRGSCRRSPPARGAWHKHLQPAPRSD